jgi:hypothetical protein
MVNKTITVTRSARRNRRNNNNRNSESNILTGGSRDYKPEYMTFLATQAVADTNLTVPFPLPIMRNFSSANGSRAQVVEALKVLVQFSDNLNVGTATDERVRVAFSTKNHGATTTTLADPDTFAVVGYQTGWKTSGGCSFPLVQTFDFTDGMGNGILIGTDNIYVQIHSEATNAAQSMSAKLFYRIYSASVEEYVGIVQSQQ